MSRRQLPGTEPFDGIICIGGEDWWYHNRGHFDFQIMRRLAKHCPVLFVNSIAVRMPSLGEKREFAAKIGRKIKSLSRGLVRVEDGFAVISPFAVPGATGQALSHWALAPQIRIAARRLGIKRPLLWVHCPAGASLIEKIPHTAVVMQRTDRFEAFPEADPTLVGGQIADIKRNADMAVYCNALLMAEEADQVASSTLVTHGVDLERFVTAGRGHAPEPADVAALPHPRVGFIGGIDAHTFGIDLFLDTVRRQPNVNFIMIGACSLGDDWCPYPNVTFLGRKPYDQVADYMAAMDVLIMPWNDSDWIKACNPIKLKEYLAVGRPVVTSDFPALDPYRDLVRVADDGAAFAAAISLALSEPYQSDAAISRVASETWDAKADALMATLRALKPTGARVVAGNGHGSGLRSAA